MLKDVLLISRSDIPAIHEVEEGGKVHTLGEHRDFSRHPLLREHIPENARLGISWVKLGPGQTLDPHLHPIVSMIIICRGAGSLLGDLEGDLKEGDVVLVGAGRLHGFVGGEPSGFTGLSVQFELRGLYEDKDRALVTFPSPSQI
jgi:quercetin dioxygenase-like cupin family protein